MPRLSTLRILASAFLLDLLAVSFVFVFGSSYLLNRLDTPATYPGYALAVYGSVKLAVAPVGGWLLNQAGWRVGVTASLALIAVGLPIAWASGTAAGFLVCVGFVAGGVSVAWLVVFGVAGRAATSDEHGPLGAWLGLTAIAAAGAALGVGSLLAIARSFSPAAIFAAAVAVTFAVLLSRTSTAGTDEAPRPVAAPAGGENVSALGAVSFAHFAVTTGVAAIIIPFLLRTLDLQVHEALVVVAPAGALAAGTMLWSGRHTWRGRRFAFAGLFYLAPAAALMAASPAGSPVVVAILVAPLVAGFAGVVPQVNAAVLGVSRRAAGRGGAMGWIFLAQGLGAVAGPLAGSGAISLLGVRASLAAAGVVLAALAATVTIAGRTKWLP